MLVSSRDTFIDTPRNNVLPAIWASLNPVKWMNKISHHIPREWHPGSFQIRPFLLPQQRIHMALLPSHIEFPKALDHNDHCYLVIQLHVWSTAIEIILELTHGPGKRLWMCHPPCSDRLRKWAKQDHTDGARHLVKSFTCVIPLKT